MAGDRAKRPRTTSQVPVSFELQMSVRGGRLKKPTVIPMDVAMHGGAECRFTLVTHRTPWLCEMVSGVRHWSSPLKGASILRKLRKLVMNHETAATAVLQGSEDPVMDDKMAGLVDSEDESPEVRTPVKSKRLKAQEPTVIEVKVPVSATAENTGAVETRTMLLLRCSDLQVRIELDALPWLVQQMQTELDGSSW